MEHRDVQARNRRGRVCPDEERQALRLVPLTGVHHNCNTAYIHVWCIEKQLDGDAPWMSGITDLIKRIGQGTPGFRPERYA